LRQRLLASFRSEAAERLATLADLLANWRESGASGDAIESLFREVHSIKGASRAAGVGEIEQLCHAWESLLGAVRHGDLELTPGRVELCCLTLRLVQRLHAGQAVERNELLQVIDSLDDSVQGLDVELPAVPVAAPEAPQDLARVRVAAEHLDALLYHGEVLLQHKREAQAQAHARGPQEPAQACDPQRARRMLGAPAPRRPRDSLDQSPASAR